MDKAIQGSHSCSANNNYDETVFDFIFNKRVLYKNILQPNACGCAKQLRVLRWKYLNLRLFGVLLILRGSLATNALGSPFAKNRNQRSSVRASNYVNPLAISLLDESNEL